MLTDALTTLPRLQVNTIARRTWWPMRCFSLPSPDSSVVERGLEKAGVGGSISSLATTSKSITCRRNLETASDLREPR